MDPLSSAALALGGSWSAGVNMYLTMLGLGIAHRADWLQLPGELEILTHPLIMLVAGVLLLVEFFADKVPYVDSSWDAVHTLIRPLGGAALGYLAASEFGPAVQAATGLVGGGIALDSHLTKATARAAINTSPEPFSNWTASVTEDVSVVGVLFLIMNYPIIAICLIALFILFSVWFLKVMFKFLKKVFQSFGKKVDSENSPIDS